MDFVTWRKFHPSKKQFTWRRCIPFVHCRLDYHLVSLPLLKYITNVEIIPAVKSDHSAILVKIDISKTQRGNVHWKVI